MGPLLDALKLEVLLSTTFDKQKSPSLHLFLIGCPKMNVDSSNWIFSVLMLSLRASSFNRNDPANCSEEKHP